MGYIEYVIEGQPAAWGRERARLVALCARMTGDAAAAEDLAQEALLEAWRHLDDLRDPERASQWLSGIARNVCLRWARRRRRDLSRTTALGDPDKDGGEAPPGAVRLADGPAGAADFEVELERAELAALLDRALALLPPETRATLVAHYVEETPLAEIAARQGTRIGAVAMRLHRGKLALRRAFAGELGAELAAYRADLARAEVWEETRIWCAICGGRRLLGRSRPDEGRLWLRCPACCRSPDDFQIRTNAYEILGGAKGYRRACARLMAWTAGYYLLNLRAGVVPCQRCGRPLAMDRERPAYIFPSAIGNDRGLHHHCPACDVDCWESLDGLMLATPAGRRFLRAHPRIRTLPHYAVEAEGRPALVTRYESVADGGRLVLIADEATFEPLRVEGGGEGGGI